MLMRPNLVPRAFSLGKRPWERGWMRPSKAETAVHGCHCPGDMAVRMRKVLARPWVGVECVTCFYCCNFFRAPFRVSKNFRSTR